MVYNHTHIFQFILNCNGMEILYNLQRNCLHIFFLLIQDRDFLLLLQPLILMVFHLSYLYLCLFLFHQAIILLKLLYFIKDNRKIHCYYLKKYLKKNIKKIRYGIVNSSIGIFSISFVNKHLILSVVILYFSSSQRSSKFLGKYKSKRSGYSFSYNSSRTLNSSETGASLDLTYFESIDDLTLLLGVLRFDYLD